MKRALKITVFVIGIVLLAAVAFYIGQQMIIAAVVRERLATEAVQRVEFLKQFRSTLPDAPRNILEAELATMTVMLDSTLHKRALLFVDRKSVQYARDSGLVYFHVFPLDAPVASGSTQFGDALSGDTRLAPLANSPFLESFHQGNLATDAALATLLRNFEPAKLDSNNRLLLDKLTKQKQAP